MERPTIGLDTSLEEICLDFNQLQQHDASDSEDSDDGESTEEVSSGSEEDDQQQAVEDVEIVSRGPYPRIKYPTPVSNFARRMLQKIAIIISNSGNAIVECPSKIDRRGASLAAVLEYNKRSIELRLPPRKIYYVTKTFQEISEVTADIRKLRRTGYLEDTKIVILGSRSDWCINENVVSRQTTNPILDACKNLTRNYLRQHVHVGEPVTSGSESLTCKFFCPQIHNDPQKGLNVIRTNRAIQDIEDFKARGRQDKFCPYFYNKNDHTQADLILCQQEFIVSSACRNEHNINLEDAIIIFDDASNIEKILADEGSLSISTLKMEYAARQLNTIAESVQNHYFSRSVPSQSQQAGTTYNNAIILQLASALLKFSEWIKMQPRGKTAQNEILQALRTCGFEQRHRNFRVEFKKFNTFISESTAPIGNLDETTTRNILKWLTVLGYIYDSVEALSTENFAMEISRFNPKDSRNEIVIFNIVCVNPGVIFKHIERQASSVILMSGSMTPINIMKEELQADFDEVIFDNQDITRCCFAYCGKGPNGISFQLTHNDKGRTAVLEEIGEGILAICKDRSGGVVILFPSKDALQSNLDCWKESENRHFSILTGLKQIKHVFSELEMANPEDAKRGVDKFRELCTNPTPGHTGALLLALHRGKCIEMMNFHQREVQTFVHCGIPYASRRAFNIIAKQEFFKTRYPGNYAQKENQWYNAEAFRIMMADTFARFISSRQGEIAVVVLDERMIKKEDSFATLIPVWIRNELNHCGSFSDLLQKLNEL